MSTAAEIQRAMSDLLRRSANMEPAEVVEVDKSTKTVTVMTIDGVEIPDVRLRSIIKSSDAVVLYPKVNSVVLISAIGDEMAANYKVVAVEEVEAVEAKIGEITLAYDAEGIQLNGDSLGGLVKAKELKLQVSKNTQVLNAMQTAFNNWIPPTGAPDSGALLKAASVSFITLPLADLDNIENDIITHG